MIPLIHASTYWTSQNIVLDVSQIGLESDTNQYKIGDGTTAWNDLTYYATVFEYAVASGTDTYTCNFGKSLLVSNNIPDYFTGLRIWVKFTNANTGACTLNMNGYGAKGIKKNVTTALASGDILAGGIYVLVYDGTNFQIEGVGSGGGGTYTVDNGLTENVAGNFQLGGQLTHITSIGTIDDDSFYLEILGDAGNYSSNGILYVHGAQYGIGGQGSSVGVTGTADSIPLWAVNTSTGRNNIVDGVVINRANANALTGLGVQIHINLSDSAGGVDTASLLITKWTTATAGNETAQFEVWLKTAGATETRKLALAGSGQLILDKYGINTFAGVPTYALGVNATGNIVEFAVAGGGGGIPIATAGGTVDIITATYSPVLTLADKVMCRFVASGQNTSTTPTFNPDGLGAKTIVKNGGQPLVAGDIPNALAVCDMEYNLANTRWELLNPAIPSKVITQPSGTSNTTPASTQFVNSALAQPTASGTLYLFYNLS